MILYNRDFPKTHLKMSLLLFFLSLGVINAQVEDFLTGNRLLSSEIFSKILVGNTANLVISPYSLETLLAIIQSGAKDETGEQIRKGLHFPSTQEETEDAMKYIVSAVQGDYSSIATLNRISSSIPINDDFKQRATDAYQANFRSFEEAGSLGTLASASKLTLVNDVALAANWETPFTFTNRSKFYTSWNYSILVNTMSVVGEYNYYESTELDAKFLELPFKEEGNSLTIVIPNYYEGLSSLEKRLDEVLETPQYTKTSVLVEVPQFRVSSIIDFKSILQSLGVRKVFDASEADLSGIAGDKGDLYIEKIQQEVDIDVDRSMAGGAADGEIDDYKILASASTTFAADHPFIFYVTVQDVIVFLGRVLEPRV